MKLHVLPLALLLVLGGCTLLDGGDGDGCESLSDRLDRLEADVQAAIGEAEAGSVAACRAVAFGAKPCGGPWTYLVYSATTSDPAEVEALVSRYNAIDERRNAACGLVSTCEVTAEPEVALVDGRCVADFGG